MLFHINRIDATCRGTQHRLTNLLLQNIHQDLDLTIFNSQKVDYSLVFGVNPLLLFL